MNAFEVDGRTVVRIQRTTLSFKAIESGRLSHDGEALWLETDSGNRQFSDDELNQLQLVIAGNSIAACKGFDFFLLIDN